MADLRCARTRLPIPGTYTQRVVQVTDRLRAQEPPDYRTQIHELGAGVYCSPTCAVLHVAESLVLDGELPGDALAALSEALLGDGGRYTPCVAALPMASTADSDKEPF